MPEQNNAAAQLAARIDSNFTIGAATASWQIEGDSQGRGRSIWDDFADKPGSIVDGTKADPACEHIARWREDLELMSWLGIDSYRFSVSWPRVIPGGAGKASESGLGFYDQLIDGLLERGIAPALTLYHWDLPSELEAKGGWLNPDTAKHFADYADLLAGRFADRVDRWATLNEPWVSAFLGYATKIHAPGLGNPAAGLEAAYRLMVSHSTALAALRANGAKNAGTVLNLTTIISDDPSCEGAVRHVDGLQNRIWLDLLAGRGIAADILENTSHLTDWGFVSGAELTEIAKPIDWLGINYYTPNRIVRAEQASGGKIVGQNNDVYPGTPDYARFESRAPKTEMGWEIHAPSLGTTLHATAERLPGVPLYITENGGAFADDKFAEDGTVLDHDRVDYLINHIGAVLDARDAGVDVRGYYAWSLLDNIEWAEGLTKRFGICRVDFDSQKRTPKLSAQLIRAIATGRG
jgi:beta-glucosidase